MIRATGRVDVTPEQADIHNRLLDEALIKGLDENCEIGQGGTFYYNERENKVTTFSGTLVSMGAACVAQKKEHRKRRTIWFWRQAKQYKGILRKDADCFNFRRIA